jgi:Coenzyme PQQ synthesis protein D (PqqD)
MVAAMTYEICTPSVVGEVIDGEAIIMDLRSGAYYSSDGVGGAVWQAIELGASHAEILDWARAAFAADEAVAEVEAFLRDLLARDLIRATSQAGAPVAIPPYGAPYAPPALSVHEDMQDLILLDPIHDVDEMGWPTRKVDA